MYMYMLYTVLLKGQYRFIMIRPDSQQGMESVSYIVHVHVV